MIKHHNWIVIFTLLSSLSGAAIAATLENPAKVPAYQAVFEANVGQFPKTNRFISRSPVGLVSFTNAGPIFLLSSADTARVGRQGEVSLRFVNGNSNADIEAGQPLSTTTNYFTSSTPHRDVPTYGRLTYRSVYRGIDAVFYGARDLLEYDFVVSPGADPRDIRLRFAGAHSVRIDLNGDLIIEVAGGTLIQRKPVAFQVIAGRRALVECEYRLRGGDVVFSTGQYDVHEQLTIDPIYTFSTTIGGNANDSASAISIAPSGDIYVVGNTSSPDMPNTTSITDNYRAAARQVFVARLKRVEDHYVLAAASYLGCREQADCGANPSAFGVAVDASNHVYVTGGAGRGYMTADTAYKQYMTDRLNSRNAFVTKLNPALDTIVYSTYLGGTNSNTAYAIAVDSEGSAYVTGATVKIGTSANDLPIKPAGVIGPTGTDEAFVAKLAPDGRDLTFSTYLGGPPANNGTSDDGIDKGQSIAVDSSKRVYVVGVTKSPNFPRTNALQNVAGQAALNSGVQDGFVTVLAPDATSYVYSTYLGGSGNDEAKGIAIRKAAGSTPDEVYEAFVTGTASAPNFPSPPGADALICGGSAFVAQIDKSAALKFSACLHSGTSGTAIAVSSDVVWITGDWSSADGTSRATWTTTGVYPTASKYRPIPTGEQPAGAGGVDSFIARLDMTEAVPPQLPPPPLMRFTYLTYLGGKGDDTAAAIAIEPVTGAVWTTGTTRSGTAGVNDFRRTGDALFPAKAGTDIYVKRSFGDQDGDGLCDTWEEDGVDADGDGIIDLNLSQYQVNIAERDIFVEVDYLETSPSVVTGAHSHRPDREPLLFTQPLLPNPLNLVSTAFTNAPDPSSPGTTKPIHLHAMVDESIEETADNKIVEVNLADLANIRYGHCTGTPCVRVACGSASTARFGSVADRNSPNCTKLMQARRFVFRYALFGHEFEGGSGVAPIMGNDILVALKVADPIPAGTSGADYWLSARNLANSIGTTPQHEYADMVAGTFMHELGHSLGLFHGGGFGLAATVVTPDQDTGTGSVLLRDVNYKPNYLSVMNYAFQFNKWGYQDTARTPALARRTDRPIDYSREKLDTLGRQSLVESTGVGTSAGWTLYGDTAYAGGTGTHRLARIGQLSSIDWNGDGQIGAAAVQCMNGTTAVDCTPEWYLTRAGASGNIVPSGATNLEGHDDWSNVVFDFRSSQTFSNNGAPGLQSSEIPIERDIAEDIFPPPPEVWIVSPVSGAVFDSAPTQIAFDVAITGDVPIAKVEFFTGFRKIGEAGTWPFAFTWTSAELGEHRIWALATDELGLQGISQEVEINLTCPTPQFGGVADVVISACVPVLKWDAPVNPCAFAMHYNVYRSESPTLVPDSATLIAECVKDTSYSDRTALPGRNYTYVVRAENYGEYCFRGGNEDANLVRKSVVTPAVCARPVESLTVVVDGGTNTVQWSNPPGSSTMTTRIVFRTDGSFPATPEDGITAGTVAGAGGLKQSFTHATTAAQGLWYSIFHSSAGHESDPVHIMAPRPVPGIDWTLVGSEGDFDRGVLQNGTLYAIGAMPWLTALSADDGLSLPDWNPVRPDAHLTNVRAVPAGIAGPGDMLYGTVADGQLCSIDLDTGDILWSDWSADQMPGNAAVMSESTGSPYDAVISGSYNTDSYNYLIALDPVDGSYLWVFDNDVIFAPVALGIFSDLRNAIGVIAASPAVDAGRIYFGSHRKQGGTQNTLWCLDTGTEEPTKLWAVDVGDVDTTPLVQDGVVYVGSADGVIHALDAATGAVRWTLETNDGPVIDAIVGTGPFYFATASKVWSFHDIGTPSVTWSVDIQSPSHVFVSGGRILVGTDDGKLYELAADGSTTRTASVGDGSVHIVGALSGVAHVVSGNRITALDLQNPIESFVLSPAILYPNQAATGTLTLSTTAPPGGVTIPLTSSSPGVSVPASVTIPEDGTTAVFSVPAMAGATLGLVTVTAESAWPRSASLTLATGPAITALSINPPELTGGEPAAGTVTLASAAPPGGAMIRLASDSAAVLAPAGVTIGAGQTTASFALNTIAPPATTTATVTATYVNSMASTLTVNAADPPVITSLSADHASPSSAGTAISWTAIATGGEAPLYYRFSHGQAGGAFVVMCDESTSNICTWNPGLGDVGNHTIRAEVRSARSTVGYEDLEEVTFSVVAPPVMIDLTADKASPQFTGTTITWTIAATGGIAPLEYKFWRSSPAGVGTLVQDWSPGNTYTWTPGPGEAGIFEIHAFVRSAGSSSSYEDTRMFSMELMTCQQQISPPQLGAETVWVDDQIPAGATLYGPTQWDASQKASGTQSLTRPAQPGVSVLAFSGATATMPLTWGENVVFYMLINECSRPSKLNVRWEMPNGTWKGLAWGEATSGHTYMGAVPAGGNWIRVEVPASILGLEAKTISGFHVYVYDGQAWFDRIGKSGGGCYVAAAPLPTLGTETAWTDDGLPAGANLYGTTQWDAGQKASGLQSLTRPGAPGENVFGVVNATATMPLTWGESLVFYILTNECMPPVKLLAQWGATDGTWGGAAWGQATGGHLYKGPMPTPGVWTRVEIPASQLNLESKSIKDFVIYSYNGQSWVDRIGKKGQGCNVATAPPPPPVSGETIWVDDQLPAGASPYGPLQWTTNQKASGSASITRPKVPGESVVGFANATLPVTWGENLVFYVLTNECDPPRKLVAEWSATNGTGGGVTWGESHWNYPNMGPVPAGGTWTRIEIPAALLNLEAKSISSFLFYSFDGGSWIDRIGKSGEGCYVTTAPPPPPVSGETIWVDDQLPAGASPYGPLQWTANQKASGSASITRPTIPGESVVGFVNATATMPVTWGESLVFYVLTNECDLPRKLVAEWSASDGSSGGVTWGESHWSYPNMGPVPAGGTWTRVEIPAALLNLEAKSISTFLFYSYDGGSWIDRIGKVGQGCYLGTAVAPAIPTGDRVWMEDDVPAGGAMFPEMYWDQTRKASGTRSVTRPLVPGQKSLIFSNATTTMTPGHGETLFFYALLHDCAPPTSVRVLWQATDGAMGGRAWGLNASGGPGDAPLPAPGVWTRYEVPAEALGLEYRAIKTVQLTLDGGQVWVDRIGVGPAACYPAASAAPTVPPGDTVWIEDSLPGGATLSGPTFWDVAQKATGTQSLTRTTGIGENVFGISNATDTMNVTWGENLVFYIRTNECLAPRKLLAQWGATDGTWGGLTWGEATNGHIYMGPMPAVGVWTRVEIPASQLNLEAKSIRSFAIYAYDGQAWVDHVGKSGAGCSVTPAPAPTMPAGDTVWMDDAIPGGSSPSGSPQWDPAQKASGSQSMTRPAQAGVVAYGFGNATETMPVGWGESLVFYSMTNECVPPSQIVVQWVATDGSWGGASWGEAQSGHAHMGPLPAAGTWTRMEVPASLLLLEGTSIKGFYFYVKNGQAWVDHVGKSGTGCFTATAPPPTFGSETVWVDDTLPAGAAAYGATRWDTGQEASGSQSLTRPARTGENVIGFSNATATMPVAWGDQLVFYMMTNECARPRKLIAQWVATDGSWGGVSWGETTSGHVYGGVIPASGAWTRYEIAASLLSLEAKSIKGFYFYVYDGQAWADRIGTSATSSPLTTNREASTLGLLDRLRARLDSWSTRPRISLGISAKYVTASPPN